MISIVQTYELVNPGELEEWYGVVCTNPRNLCLLAVVGPETGAELSTEARLCITPWAPSSTVCLVLSQLGLISPGSNLDPPISTTKPAAAKGKPCPAPVRGQAASGPGGLPYHQAGGEAMQHKQSCNSNHVTCNMGLHRPTWHQTHVFHVMLPAVCPR